MADEATQDTPKRRGGRKRLEPLADAKAVLEANKAPYAAYVKAQAEKDQATMDKHRAAYTLYRRAYVQDLADRRASGDLKRKPKAKAAA